MYDLIVGNTYTGEALAFLAQNKTEAEVDAIRNDWLDRQTDNSRCCVQVPTGTKKVGDTLELDWLKEEALADSDRLAFALI